MTHTFHVVARIEAAPGAAEALLTSMRTLVEDSRAEPGCVRYDVFRDTEQSDAFVFVEEWASKPEWEAHANGEAVRSFRERTGADHVARREVMQLRHVL